MIEINAPDDFYDDFTARCLCHHCGVGAGLSSPLITHRQHSSNHIEAVRHLFFDLVRFGPDVVEEYLIGRRVKGQSKSAVNHLIVPANFEKAKRIYNQTLLILGDDNYPHSMGHDYKHGVVILDQRGRRAPLMRGYTLVFPMLFPAPYYGNQWFADWISYISSQEESQARVRFIWGVYLDSELRITTKRYAGDVGHGFIVDEYLESSYSHFVPVETELCSNCPYNATECKKILKLYNHRGKPEVRVRNRRYRRKMGITAPYQNRQQEMAKESGKHFGFMHEEPSTEE